MTGSEQDREYDDDYYDLDVLDCLDIVIADIEEWKGQQRIVRDNLNQSYLNGTYRSRYGKTKRQTEDDLTHMDGVTRGVEHALSFLYSFKTETIGNHKIVYPFIEEVRDTLKHSYSTVTDDEIEAEARRQGFPQMTPDQWDVAVELARGARDNG